MPASRKVSLQQVEILLNFLEEHMGMAKGQAADTPQAKVAVRRLWEELAATLNAQGTGVHKTFSEWRDYWRDIKYRVKKKAGELVVDRRRTGGGPPARAPLSEQEQRVYAIIGTRAVCGDEHVQIPFEPELDPHPPSPSPQPPSPSPQPALPSHEHPADTEYDVLIYSPVSPLPSTSRAPPVQAGSSSAEAASPAAKRRRSGAPGAASTVEIPQPRWAWEAEQDRRALDERRLQAEERVADAIESMARSNQRLANSIESLVATLASIVENRVGIPNSGLDNGC